MYLARINVKRSCHTIVSQFEIQINGVLPIQIYFKYRKEQKTKAWSCFRSSIISITKIMRRKVNVSLHPADCQSGPGQDVCLPGHHLQSHAVLQLSNWAVEERERGLLRGK